MAKHRKRKSGMATKMRKCAKSWRSGRSKSKSYRAHMKKCLRKK